MGATEPFTGLRRRGDARAGVNLARYRGSCRLPVLLVTCVCGLAGCRGSGRIELASLSFQAIDPPSPRCTPIEMQECYWWTDADGRVWIAMRAQQTPLLYPELRFELQASLALERPPAGKARNYTVDRNTLRARIRFGPWESRLTSQAGIIALYRQGNERLRGSLRLRAARVVGEWLGGWGKPIPYLMLGSFTAVHDEQRGRAIAETSESSGWGREVLTHPAPLSFGPATTRPISPQNP